MTLELYSAISILIIVAIAGLDHFIPKGPLS